VSKQGKHKLSELKLKLALLSLYNLQYPDWSEKLLVLLEYLQLMSQGILLYSALDKTSDVGIVENIVYYFFKIVNPSCLLDYDGPSSTVWAVVGIMFGFTSLKYALSTYILLVAKWDLTGNKVLVSIWRWFFKVQARFMCYFLTSFWVNTILNISNENFDTTTVNETLLTVALGILVGVEYVFSYLLETQFCDILPRKNFLSGKNNEMQMVTLSQKLLLQIFQLCLQLNTTASFWVYCLINLVFSLWRAKRFYFTLPLYKPKALCFLGDLVSIVLGLSIASFVGVIVRSGDDFEVSQQFIIFLWIFVALFLIQITRSYLFRTNMELLGQKKEYEPALLLHKAVLTKELIKHQKLPAEFAPKVDFGYLCRVTEKYHSNGKKEATSIGGDILEDAPYLRKTVYPQYFEDLLSKAQKDPLIKLYLAKVWFKRFGLCSKTLKIIGEITQRPWSREYIGALFLLYEIQNFYHNNQITSENDFNLNSYMENQLLLNDLKDEMSKQIEMRTMIYNNMLSEVSDIGEIFNQAQLLAKSRMRISKKINFLNSIAPDYWTSHLLVFSQYYLVLENSPTKCKEYQKQYTQKFQKYEKQFSNAYMAKENIYQESNVFFVLGGHKHENGFIKQCSPSVETTCGGSKKGYISQHISNLFLPSAHAYYREFFQSILAEGDVSLLQKPHQSFFVNKNGHIFEANFCLWIHPEITKNLYLNMILRPISSISEYLVLRENGDIEGATEKIGQALGLNASTLQQSSVSIRLLSDELYQAAQAFNLVNIKKSFEQEEGKLKNRLLIASNMSKEAELANLFSSEGKEIEISPLCNKMHNLAKKKKDMKYHCRLSRIEGGPGFLTVVSFSKANAKDMTVEERSLILNDDTTNSILSERIGASALLSPLPLMRRELSKDTDKYSMFISTNFLPPDTPNTVMPSSSRGMHPETPDSMAIPSSTRKLTITMDKFPNLNAKKQTTELHAKTKRDDNELKDYISSHTSSKTNGEKHTYRALKSALNQRTYSTTFKALCCIFYAVVAIALSSQLVFKIISDNTMNDLVIKKDLLNYAQTRSYYACKMAFTIETLYLLTIGYDMTGYFSSFSTASMPAIVAGYYTSLATANNNIIALVKNLDQDIYDRLFEKDVRIYGSIYDMVTTKHITLTTFQAVNQFGIFSDYMSSLSDPVISSASTAYTFMRTNGLNDYLVRNAEVTSMFQASVDDQRDSINFFIIFCLVMTPLLLVGVAAMLIFIIYKHYSTETRYLKTFIKVHPTSIKFILENTRNFQQALMSDASFEDRKLIEFFWNQSVSLEDLHITSHHTRYDNQIVNVKKTQKKYFSFLIQTGIYMIILTTVPVWSFVYSQNSLDHIYVQQTQLQLSNRISERVTIDLMAMVEMYVSNNTLNVENSPALNQTIAAIAEIKSLRTEVLSGFADASGNYDAQVKTIVFDGEECAVYGDFNTNYCTALNNLGILTSLNNLLAYFENYLTNQLEIYQAFDFETATYEDIIVGLYQNVATLGPSSSLLAYEAQRVNGIIDKLLTQSVQDTKGKQNLIIGIFVATLFVVGCLIWVQILSKIKELDNEFKNVLQVLPPKLILSSFLLKQFLKQISEDHFQA